jgi:predicted kinase
MIFCARPSQTLNTSGPLILLLGGARAGKSTYALRLAQDGERASGDEISSLRRKD